jgi:hypothetical protein
LLSFSVLQVPQEVNELMKDSVGVNMKQEAQVAAAIRVPATL